MPAAEPGREPAHSQAFIVGRDEEIGAIIRCLSEASQSPRALALEGEAGIGKTTLWRYGVDEARRRGLLVLATTAASGETKFAFAALSDLLEPLLERRHRLPDPQRRALEVALVLADPGDVPPDPRTIAMAALGLLRLGAADAMVLLAIDDVQWLDAASATALAFVVRRIRAERVRILLAQRIEGDERPSPLGLERSMPEHLERILLQQLSLGALHRILRSRLGLTLARPVLRRVLEVCGGNPFFALEIGAVLKQREEPLQPSAPLPIPGNVHDLLRQRFDALSAAARSALLAVAATADPKTSVLESIAGSQGVEEAIASGVLVASGERMRFVHPLLGEAVYVRASAARRREVHRQLAALLDDPQERALHCALGAEAPDRGVAEALDRAAAAAHARGASETAARLWEEAARLTTPEDADSAARRTVAAANAWIDAGDHRRGRTLAENLVEHGPSGRRRSDALMAIARTIRDLTQFDALHARALEEAAGDTARRIESLIQLCYARLHTRPREAQPIAYEAMHAAEHLGERGLLVSALSMAGRTETRIGNAKGAELLRRALELEGDRRFVDAYEGPGTSLGRWHLACDELPEARRLLEQQYQRASAAGDEYNKQWLCLPLTELECRAGDYVAARRYAEQGHELAEQLANPFSLTAMLFARAIVAVHVGEAHTARSCAEAGLAAAREVGSLRFQAHHWVALGVLAAAEGAWDAARLELERAYALHETVGMEPDQLYSFWPDLAEALVALGELQRAAEILAEREQRAHALRLPGKLALCARCRGLIAAANGALDEASDALREALRLHEASPVPLERARTLLVLGRVERRAKRKASARESLAAALELFDRLAAPQWAERARAEAARIGGRPATREGLTPSEQRIAALVAEGRTNRDVAALLFVTDHTVERALTRIYGKLGVRSRAELAARWRSTPKPKV